MRGVVGQALRFDHRDRWFAVGRTLLALATASELIFTRPDAVFTTVGQTSGPLCVTNKAVSLFCVGDPHQFAPIRWWLAIIVLVFVASGFRPRWMTLAHLWIAFSVATSVTLPDGGDAIALIVVLLISPMCLADPRVSQWLAPGARMRPTGRVLAYLSFWALRVQIAYLYADSAIAKMGVEDWQNGSAFYYFVRDHMFGAAGPLTPMWLWLSDQALTTIAVTWGAIALELAIALCTLLGARWRLVAFWLGLGLHTMIFLSMGLFSFSLVMIAAGALIATPAVTTPAGRRRPWPRTASPAHNEATSPDDVQAEGA